MSTLVFVNTYTHSVTFVTDKMLISLKRIIFWIGLDPAKLTSDWGLLELGIRTWLDTKDLQTVVLEVYRPGSQTLVNRWDFGIEYGFGSGDDGTMWVDPEAIRNAIKKCGFDPAGCDYRIIAVTKPSRPDVVGWGLATLFSTDGFVRHSVGTTIGANPLGTRTAYWRKV
jgi:hypothetical protein